MTDNKGDTLRIGVIEKNIHQYITKYLERKNLLGIIHSPFQKLQPTEIYTSVSK